MSTFTIAQGLRRAKKLKGQMAELNGRASATVSYEAGKKPEFEFKATRVQLALVREDLITLQAAIAKANANASVEVDGKRMTIAEAIRRLQEFKAEMAWLPQLSLRQGVERVPEFDYDEELHRRVPRSREVTYVADLRETERVAELSALRDRFERLNDAVETANHRTTIEWKEQRSSSDAVAVPG